MLSRRGFLLAGLAGGGIALVGGAGGYAFLKHRRTAWRHLNTDPNIFLRIDSNSTVTVVIKHLEMGQGIMTGLSTLVAEELDADWSQIRAELAPSDQQLFKNGLYGRQATAASSSIHNSWKQMRQIGAVARHMLIATAAHEWDVDTAEVTIEQGQVLHKQSGQSKTFGDLAQEAMNQPLPDVETLKLKEPNEWRLIGKDLTRPDGPSKIDGTAQFSIDIRRPNMLHGVVSRAPRFGAKLASFNAQDALATDGVVEVFEIPSGVVVLAENTWAAIKGREVLVLNWENSKAELRSSAEMWNEYETLADGVGVLAVDKGDPKKAVTGTTELEHFEFRVPFLAHASLEPLNAVIELNSDKVLVWAGCQLHTLDQWAVADTLGVERKKVHIETPFTGSSFGRRAYSRSDWMVELANVAKGSTLNRPIQILWTREDDLAGGVYRPMALHRAQVGLDEAGKLRAWEHKVVCKSLMQDTPWEVYLQKNGVDRASVGGS